MYIYELRDDLVIRDINELQQNITDYLFGRIGDDEFRSKRTSKGIYSQRQAGVQMVRIKVPLGKLTPEQLLTIADLAGEYASGLLHITTRQDIQLYHVPLNKTPDLWVRLELAGITLLGSGGNMVRNVTISPAAGVDPNEPFDVTPFAYEVFKYFLRNPVSQEMGRKIKISFSSSETDTAFSYIHDLGFIPKTTVTATGIQRGFKVMIAGGLGAQPMLAHVAYEFLPADEMMPFIEAVLRVFGRYGERNSRHKARLKFLIKNIGLKEFMSLVEKEKIANKVKVYKVYKIAPVELSVAGDKQVEIVDTEGYGEWFHTNVFEQKQKGFYGAYVKIPAGDITVEQVRKLVESVKPYIAGEMVLTQTQGILLKFILKEDLPLIYNNLKSLGLAVAGYDSTANITTCRGTNTCNLGITNSLALTAELEKLIREEHAEFIHNRDIKIKSSGCMNSCAHHSLAHIGFHGSSIKLGGKVLPAVQVLLGGGTISDGGARIADKIIKVPVRRAPAALNLLLDDYNLDSLPGEKYHTYYDRKGKEYFYRLLKHLANLDEVNPGEFIDWGNDQLYATAIGAGECAAPNIDLVDVLFRQAKEKLEKAEAAFEEQAYADSIFYSYSTFLGVAKALLLTEGVNSGTQVGIINEFEKRYQDRFGVLKDQSFSDLVLQISHHEPRKKFAIDYLEKASKFVIEIESLLFSKKAFLSKSMK
jgi:sulfite reductase (ferredoxin)